MATIIQTNGINIGSNCTGITIVSCSFKGNSNGAVVGSGWNNGDGVKVRALACIGVSDTPYISRGTTAKRPSSPQAGQQYYDASLGIPIWWNSVSNTWKNAAGNNV